MKNIVYAVLSAIFIVCCVVPLVLFAGIFVAIASLFKRDPEPDLSSWANHVVSYTDLVGEAIQKAVRDHPKSIRSPMDYEGAD